MGRGSRQGNAALRVAAMPRRLATAQRVGQKRYFVDRERVRGYGARVVGESREPGYLRSAAKHLAAGVGSSYERLSIREEIVAADKDGRLKWIPRPPLPYAQHMDYYGIEDLTRARKLCDQLNKHPLGNSVEQEINDKGDLVIVKRCRRFASGGELVETDLARNSYDVSDPQQAAAAQQCYQKFTADIAAARNSEVGEAIAQLHESGDERARRFFADAEASKRAREAERLAEAIDQGQAEQLLDQLEQPSPEAAARAADMFRSWGALNKNR